MLAPNPRTKTQKIFPATTMPHFATLLLLLLFPLQSSAQTTRTNGDDNSYSGFSTSMAILVAILISSTFFAGILYIYIRKCTDASSGVVLTARRVPRGTHRAAASGLDASVIASFPTMVYSEVKDSRIGKGALECAVCLSEFEDDEPLRLIPTCDHVFHPDCIDTWLGSHTTCPVCRADLVPQPGDSVAKPPEFARPDSDIEAQSGEPLDLLEVNTDGRRRRFLWSRSMERPQIQPGDNSERFTLRLSGEMRTKIMERSKSMILATERSSPRGYRAGGDGSSRGVKLEQSSFMRFQSFLLRMPSIKSAKVAANSDGEGTSTKV